MSTEKSQMQMLIGTLHSAPALADATTMATGSEMSRMSSGKPHAQATPREDFLGQYTALHRMSARFNYHFTSYSNYV